MGIHHPERRVRGGRRAIAYLSIGEAENYRWYFDSDWTDNGIDDQPDSDAPRWLCRTNPDWAGNFKVQYWSDAWRTIVLEYVDKLIEYGFDGVYLDIIDGFEHWSDPGKWRGLSLERSRGGGLHDQFREENRRTRESILESAEKADYLAVMNGIGIEDLFHDERTATTDSTC